MLKLNLRNRQTFGKILFYFLENSRNVHLSQESLAQA